MIHNGWVAPYGTQAERSSGARIFHGRDVATPRARPGKCGDRTRWLEKSEKRSIIMPKYVIEREIAGAGKLSSEELRKISAKSCSALQKLGPTIQWVQSYVTDDKVYCVYIAPNEAMVREHAKQGGFPANKVSEVRGIVERDAGFELHGVEQHFGPEGKCDRTEHILLLYKPRGYR